MQSLCTLLVFLLVPNLSPRRKLPTRLEKSLFGKVTPFLRCTIRKYCFMACKSKKGKKSKWLEFLKMTFEMALYKSQNDGVETNYEKPKFICLLLMIWTSQKTKNEKAIYIIHDNITPYSIFYVFEMQT